MYVSSSVVSTKSLHMYMLYSGCSCGAKTRYDGGHVHVHIIHTEHLHECTCTYAHANLRGGKMHDWNIADHQAFQPAPPLCLSASGPQPKSVNTKNTM